MALLVATASLLVPVSASAAGTVTISGTISTPAGPLSTDGEGGAVENFVNVLRASDGESVAWAYVGLDGGYSVDVPMNDDYLVKADVHTGSWPDRGTKAWLEEEVSVGTANVVVDLDAAYHRPVTVRLVGPDGTPRGGRAVLSCFDRFPSRWFEGEDSRERLLLNSHATGSGDLGLWGFPVTLDTAEEEGCHLTVSPAAGTPQYRPLVVDPSGSNVVEVVIPTPVTLSGTVALPDADTDLVSIDVVDAVNQGQGGTALVVHAEVGPDGTYAVPVSPGQYHVTATGSSTNGRQFVLDAGTVDISADTVLDLGPWVPARVHLVDDLAQPTTAQFSVYCSDWPDGGSDLDVQRSGSGPVDFPAVAGADGWECYLTLDGSNTQHRIQVGATDNEYTWIVPRDVVLAGAPGASNDDDGVPDLLEALGPNGGDGNGDGTLDVDQAHVTSLPANGSTDPGDPYVTIAAPAGTTLEDVSTLDPATLPTPPPAGTTLPAGLASFTLSGIEPPGTDQVLTIHTSDTTGVNGYAKYDPTTETWSTLPSERVSVFADRVEITLTDGGVGDADGVADGRIVDPGGIAVVPEGDRTPPEVTGTLQRPPDANGWYNAPVSVDWSATDPSGVGALPPPTEVTNEGSAVTATSPPVCDLAEPANCGTGEVNGIKLDLTPPHVEVNGPTDGATYTLGEVPEADCAATDALSGLAGPCSITQVGGNSNGVGFFVATAEAVDEAGNSSATRVRYRVVYRVDGFLPPVNDPAISPGEAMSVFRRPSLVPVAMQITDAHGVTVEPVIRPVWLPPVRGDRTRAPVNEAFYRGRGSSGWLLSWRDGAWRYAWDTDDVDRGYTYRLRVLLDDGTVREVTIGLR
ncbi:choice-of-anchor U domain-containing protein [Nocardioides coralli]|uniref:choice-of-anchor U domain-containing protein n=1 Tax=Nocardioides coralli TaxID=2872154 RepID=UPI001CA466D3|nr:choice-of-anchor U domain-containing protein [Nocardioides coralli]QZY27731.1 PxKF domain-containing protein [Nocardioides coralli]